MANVFAAEVADEENAEQRNAVLCEVIHNSILNLARWFGASKGLNIPDSMYLTRDHYLPGHFRAPKTKRPQTWGEMKANLGFK